MKFFILTATFVLLTLSSSFGGEDNPVCINRSSKIFAEFISQNSIEISFDRRLRSVSLTSVIGIDGLDVIDHTLKATSINNMYELEVYYDQPPGRSYLVLSFEFDELIGGVMRNNKEVITLSVGEYSEGQKNKINKNVKFYKLSRGGNRSGRNDGDLDEVSVQELPLQRKN